jgi:hypothetical protein
MRVRMIRNVKQLQFLLAIGLYTSGLLGLELVISDKYLWTASPTHALGLLGFIAIDLILLIALWAQVPLANIGAMLISIVQLGAMLADLANGHPIGISQDAFRNYLLNDIGFVSLLMVQAITLVFATGDLVGRRIHLAF